LRCRVLCDVEIDDAPALVRQDHEHEQHLACHSGNSEEVTGDQVFDMVVQKGSSGW
jgi:hypothetical protein